MSAGALRILTFFLFIFNICAQDKQFFRFDYKYVEKYQAHYKYFQRMSTFSEAVETCLEEDAELWAPKSYGELFHIYGNFQNQTFSPLNYLGYYRFGSNNKFISIDGFDLEKTHIMTNFSFNNDCTVGDRFTIANNMYCSRDTASFICKRDKKLAVNKPCENYDPAYVWIPHLKSCYKFHTRPSTWIINENTCRAENATLVIINSDEEAYFLKKEFQRRPAFRLQSNFEKEHVHVGFSNKLFSNVYLTLKGETLFEAGYSNWDANEPNPNSFYCGAMSRNGTLLTVSCSDREYAMCICEKEIQQDYPPNTTTSPSTSTTEEPTYPPFTSTSTNDYNYVNQI